MSATYVHDESQIRLGAGKWGFQFHTKWNVISDSLINSMKGDWGDYKIDIKNSDFKIKVYSKCAWVVFVQSTEATYQGKKYLSVGINTRFLEKTENGWKIVYLGFVDKSSYDEAENQKDSTDLSTSKTK